MKLRAGPCGLHLFARKTGWNVLVDEVRIPPAQWARAPRQISVALTNACDLACSFCYAPKTSGSLDADRLAGWLRELDENRCFGVGFGGGEPTLHRRFIEICRETAATTNLAVTFTTHAHRITPAYSHSLKGSVHFVRVSMDGVGATYEALRGRPFAAFRSRLEIVREMAPFGINYLVNARTFAEIDCAIDFACECGAGEFLLLPEEPVDGTCGVDRDTLSSLREWVGQYRGPVPLAISESHSKDICSGTLSAEVGIRAYVHIDANGFLKRSSYDKGGVLIGPGGVMEALRQLEAGPVEGQ
ncbi:MAG: radical SAM protein [Candidatus Acidiferrum sp.]